jgi:hypothetical protein
VSVVVRHPLLMMIIRILTLAPRKLLCFLELDSLSNFSMEITRVSWSEKKSKARDICATRTEHRTMVSGAMTCGMERAPSPGLMALDTKDSFPEVRWAAENRQVSISPPMARNVMLPGCQPLRIPHLATVDISDSDCWMLVEKLFPSTNIARNEICIV